MRRLLSLFPPKQSADLTIVKLDTSVLSYGLGPFGDATRPDSEQPRMAIPEPAEGGLHGQGASVLAELGIRLGCPEKTTAPDKLESAGVSLSVWRSYSPFSRRLLLAIHARAWVDANLPARGETG